MRSINRNFTLLKQYIAQIQTQPESRITWNCENGNEYRSDIKFILKLFNNQALMAQFVGRDI